MTSRRLREHNFVRMVRRHVEGDPNPVGLRTNADGTPRTMEQIMATVHEMTESWVIQHQDKALPAVVALGQKARAETLALLAELTDEQLAEKLPGAPGPTAPSAASSRRTPCTAACTGAG